jgi:DNA-binding transcriptional LysR family regulator
MMDLRQLRSFAAVAREGSYAAAAVSQDISQPAVWRQVRELEAELSIALFERYGRHVRLTPDGAALLTQASAVLATMDRFKAAASDIRSVRAGVVGIACASPHLQHFLAPCIGAFHEAHPGVSVEVREYGGTSTPGRGIRDDLIDGVVDLATLVEPPDDHAVDGFPIYEVCLVVAVADDHPWRDRGSVEVAELRGQPLIVGPATAFSRGALESATRVTGFEPTIAFVLGSPASQLALARSGVGLSISIDDAVGGDSKRPWPHLVQDGRPLGNTVQLAWRAGATLTPAARSFVEVCYEAIPATRRPPRPMRLVH